MKKFFIIIIYMFLISCSSQEIDYCKGELCSEKGECIVENSKAKCSCEEGYYNRNLKCLPIIVDYSCMGEGCESFCSCSAFFCIPEEAAHAGAIKTNVCTTFGCNTDLECRTAGCDNEEECKPDLFCMKSPHDDQSFCAQYEKREGIGELTFNVDYKGDKSIKRVGIRLYDNKSFVGKPDVARISPLENDTKLTFPRVIKITPFENKKYWIKIYGDTYGDGYDARVDDPTSFINDVDLDAIGKSINIELIDE